MNTQKTENEPQPTVHVEQIVSTYNMNDVATVKLTKEGEKIYREHFKDFPELIKMQGDKSLTTHLWELFHIFGNDIYMGCSIPFQNNIISFNKC